MVGDVEINDTADGKCEITLKDVSGNVLDVYTIDRQTGEGTNSANEPINLPQTGNYSLTNVFIALAAFMMIIFGAATAKSSRVFDILRNIGK